eukprot:TRINITY_DN16_c0_g3_i4.p1 TRINITY_DN16_c0_g3~~TRINITY_DN16_c0_g3_i4.p1  ORF type:complete len:600 (+),score=193.22 TRINITY_DN16_c0_g3_i4:28-1800(+)
MTEREESAQQDAMEEVPVESPAPAAAEPREEDAAEAAGVAEEIPVAAAPAPEAAHTVAAAATEELHEQAAAAEAAAGAMEEIPVATEEPKQAATAAAADAMEEIPVASPEPVRVAPAAAVAEPVAASVKSRKATAPAAAEDDADASASATTVLQGSVIKPKKRVAPTCVLNFVPLEQQKISSDLETTITEHESAGSYVTYTIDTVNKKNGNHQSVVRRYSDFLWLQEQLKFAHPALFIPPLPEKSLTTKFAADHIEYRIRELERFLQRVSAHGDLAEDPCFVSFIGANQQDFQAFVKSHAGSSAVVSSLKLFGAITAKVKHREPDSEPAVNEAQDSVARVEKSVQDLIAATNLMTANWRDLCQIYALFAENVHNLSKVWESTEKELGANCESISTSCNQITLMLKDMVVCQSTTFEEALRDHLREIEAVKELLDRRHENFAKYKTTMAAVTARREKVEKGKLEKGKTVQDEIKEIDELSEQARREFEGFGAQLKAELLRVKTDRAAATQLLLRGLAQLHAEFHAQVGAAWKQAFVQASTAQVPAEPSKQPASHYHTTVVVGGPAAPAAAATETTLSPLVIPDSALLSSDE